jgi:hypothetical protein
MKDDDPGIGISWTDDSKLHACLRVPGPDGAVASLATQRVDAAASGFAWESSQYLVL